MPKKTQSKPLSQNPDLRKRLEVWAGYAYKRKVSHWAPVNGVLLLIPPDMLIFQQDEIDHRSPNYELLTYLT